MSRGMKFSEFLKGRRWLEGLQYLWKAEERWPETVLDISLDVEDKEARRVAGGNAVNVDNPAPTVELISFFSDWKLKRALAWYLKLKSWLKEKCKNSNQSLPSSNNAMRRNRTIKQPQRNSLSLEDLLNAEISIISYCQHQKFNMEFKIVATHRKVSCLSPIYKLDPIFEDGMLSVGGRLHRSVMPEESKHPVILV